MKSRATGALGRSEPSGLVPPGNGPPPLPWAVSSTGTTIVSAAARRMSLMRGVYIQSSWLDRRRQGWKDTPLSTGGADASLDHRQRSAADARRGASSAARAFPSRHLRPHRHARRLRNEHLRCVHGSDRRQGGEVVHALRRAGRRGVGADRRGPRARRPAPFDAASVLGRARPAVRLLHARDDADRRPASR